jgi:hypothetical protein
MSERLQFDDEWLTTQLKEINGKLSPIPAMEQHLQRQNNSIEKHALGLDALEVRMGKLEYTFERRIGQIEMALDRRVSALERTSASAEAGWNMFVSSVLKVVVGVATGVGVTLLLLNLFGIR